MALQSKFGEAEIIQTQSKFGATIPLDEEDQPQIPGAPAAHPQRVEEEIALERFGEALGEPFEDLDVNFQKSLEFFGLQDTPLDRSLPFLARLPKKALQAAVAGTELALSPLSSLTNAVFQAAEELTDVPREELLETVGVGTLPLAGVGGFFTRLAKPRPGRELARRDIEAPEAAPRTAPEAPIALEGEIIPPTVAERGRGAIETAQAAINEKLDSVFPPSKQVKSVLGDTLKLDKLDIDQIITQSKAFEATNQRRPTLLELGKENIEGLARKAGGEVGEGRAIIENFRTNVLEAQTKNVREIAERTLVSPDQNFFDDVTALEVQMRKNAQPLYEQAFSQIIPVNPKMIGFVNTPSGKIAMKKAINILKQEGKDPEALGLIEGVGKAKTRLKKKASIEALDAIKRGFDDVIEADRDKTTGKLVLDQMGRATNTTLREYISELDKLSPVYKEARAAWAGPSSLKNALIDGRTAAQKPSVKAEHIQARLKNMTESEREVYRSGFMRGLIDTMEAGVADANRIRKLVRSEALKEKLTSVFDNKEMADAFVGQLVEAEKLAGRVQRVSPLTGSATALRQADISSFNLMQNKGNILADAAKAGYSALRQNRNIRNEQIVNRDIADILTQPLTDELLLELAKKLSGKGKK